MVGLLIGAGTALSYAVGYWIGVPVLVPLLNALAAFPFMYGPLARGQTVRAVERMLLWALTLAVCATLLSYASPERTSRLFLNGDSYRREMFEWILTGAGTESRPRAFIPIHAAHAAIFTGLSLATGSVLSLPMGAVLMNYMGHYVGALGAASQNPATTMVAAWHPWSLVRIVSFVILGVVLAGPVLARVGGFRYRLGDERRLLYVAGAGLLLDVAMKAALAPGWRRLLLGLTGW